MLFCVGVLFVVVTSTVGEPTESRLVRIDSGPIRGYKDASEDIFVYYGIPYAKAPSGSDKFKAPLPTPHWIEPFDAVDKGIICPQPDIFDLIHNKTMQEDCLIANVYVPNVENTNLPVIVYVHGGGFIMGYGDLVTPKKIVSNKEVIVVNFNYRLGAHGFLCLGTKDIPGNAGMKDQVALLRWIQNNIANFGGNPNDVTIAGYSAGSASVDLLMMSKIAQGLFKNAILESGANLSPFSVQSDPVQNAKVYAKLLKFEDEDVHSLEDFYKSISYEQLQSGSDLIRTDLLMAPCVERDHGDEIFLEDSPFNILNSGKFLPLPMLYGYANMEGSVRVPVFEHWKDKMNANFSEFLPTDLRFKNNEEKEAIADKVRRFYFKDMPVDEKNILSYVDYWSDTYFDCPTLRSASLQLKAGNNKIYLYVYSFVEDSTPVVPYTEVRGAGHCFQTVAILDGLKFNVSDESEISEDLKEMKGIIRDLWTSFAKYSQPESPGAPKWPPAGNDMSPYMELKKNPQLGQSLLNKRCDFWEEIYKNHYNIPIPPHILPPKIKTEL
ncbi:carboxylic ester hydrolase [Bicyclus anynana]|uniref:Carboxylic ester hydrolase n=1 Tax=Bicyclus anynana TaxID=110368 RepID=A0A6J1PBQ0_BICAN|nr:carboxylic ester hydrolase [Bicyclus anynana]